MLWFSHLTCSHVAEVSVEVFVPSTVFVYDASELPLQEGDQHRKVAGLMDKL